MVRPMDPRFHSRRGVCQFLSCEPKMCDSRIVQWLGVGIRNRTSLDSNRGHVRFLCECGLLMVSLAEGKTRIDTGRLVVLLNHNW